jgi:archaeosine synthase beta-subunit
MREIDLTRPVSVWRSKDLFQGREAESLTIILRTPGCSWARCTMCGYPVEGAPATEKDLLVQFGRAMERLSPEAEVVKIYTSGSFLDPGELPEVVRDHILDSLKAMGVKKLVLETRPEYITPERAKACLSRLETEFALGLETANDLVRQKSVCKGFSFQDFVKASEIVHNLGGRIKAYLLLKPPFLSEGEAIRDAVSSARAAKPYADMISLNLCNIQKKTTVERLWERGEYRPPWLWSAVEVLRNSPGPIICDPVGAGTRRGPHNCGECDGAVAEAIRKFSLTQDPRDLEGLDHWCRATWRKVVELEEKSFGTPLV